MGGRFGRNRQAAQFDPNAFPYEDPYYGQMQPPGYGMPPGGYGMPPGGYGMPPPYPYQRGGYDPSGYSGYGGYGPDDPYSEYGYGATDTFESYYGGPQRGGPNPYGGRHGRGKFQLLTKFVFRICM
jgi:hypothetical protein